jgi:hypothetical protein
MYTSAGVIALVATWSTTFVAQASLSDDIVKRTRGIETGKGHKYLTGRRLHAGALLRERHATNFTLLICLLSTKGMYLILVYTSDCSTEVRAVRSVQLGHLEHRTADWFLRSNDVKS